MESRGRKKFCLSKRIEEYHYMESESSEDEDYSSIHMLFHQQALQRKRQLEIEDKFKNEFQCREASYAANYQQISSQSNNISEEYATNYSNRSNQLACNSTPQVTNAHRQISNFALSRIDSTQSMPNHSLKSVNRSMKYDNNEPVDEPFTLHNTRKSTSNYKIRKSNIPFERLMKLAEDSPYMSPLPPTQNQHKRIITLQETYTDKSARSRRLTRNDLQIVDLNETNSEIVPAKIIPFMSPLSPVPNQNDRRLRLKESSTDKRNSSRRSTRNDSQIVDLNEMNSEIVSAQITPSDIVSNVNSEIFSIDDLFHQQALQRKQQIEIKDKSKKEFQSRETSYAANCRQISSQPNNTSVEDAKNYSNRSSNQRACTSTPQMKNALRPINARIITPKESSTDKSRRSTRNDSQIVSVNETNSEIVSAQITPYMSPSSNRSKQKNLLKHSSIDKSTRSRSTRNDSQIVDRNETNSEILSHQITPNISSVLNQSKSAISLKERSTDKSTRSERSTRNDSQIVSEDATNSEIVSDQITPYISSVLNQSKSAISLKERSIDKSARSRRSTRNDSQIVSINEEDSEIVSTRMIPSEIVSSVNSEIVSSTNDQTPTKESINQPVENSEIKTMNDLLTSDQESFQSESNVRDDDSVVNNSAIVTVNNSEIVASVDDSVETGESKENKVDETDSSSSNNSEIVSNIFDSKLKGSSEIFSNCITQLCNTSTDKSEEQTNLVKSTMPDLSVEYDINEDFNSISNHIDDRYSKIVDTDDEQEMSRESDQEIQIDQLEESDGGEQSSKEQESTESSKEEVVVELDESEQSIRTHSKDKRSELESASFSRIESNFSNVSVSFEPSGINNSIVNHLENQESEKEQQNSEFKVPKQPPKRPKGKQPGTTVKKQPSKYYETFANNTPSIIFPETTNDGDEQDQDSLIRRSNRIRVRPLEYWRNQKLKYKLDTETKCFTIEGVEKGFKPENPFSKKYTKQPNSNKRKLKRKKTKLSKIKEESESGSEDGSSTSEEDESSSEEEQEPVKRVRYSPNEELSIHQDVNESQIVTSERIKREAAEFYSKSDLVWNKSRQSDGVFIALMNRKKSAKTGTQASGFIKMMPFAEKPRQVSSDYVTKYVVMFGAVSVQIAEKPTVFLKQMDSFTVEKHTMYSIRNLRKDEALLYFDVCRPT